MLYCGYAAFDRTILMLQIRVFDQIIYKLSNMIILIFKFKEINNKFSCQFDNIFFIEIKLCGRYIDKLNDVT